MAGAEIHLAGYSSSEPSAGSGLFYGAAGALKGSDRESQEVSMLTLHVLQSALVFIKYPAHPERPERSHPEAEAHGRRQSPPLF